MLCAVLSGVFYFGSVVFKKLFLEEANILKDYESKTFEEQISSMDYELLEDADFQKNVKAYRVVYENNGGAQSRGGKREAGAQKYGSNGTGLHQVGQKRKIGHVEKNGRMLRTGQS